jgi:hypothetical protein
MNCPMGSGFVRLGDLSVVQTPRCGLARKIEIVEAD